MKKSKKEYTRYINTYTYTHRHIYIYTHTFTQIEISIYTQIYKITSLPGFPPPAPVSSHILVGITEEGIHHAEGTHLIHVTSGGSSESKVYGIGHIYVYVCII